MLVLVLVLMMMISWLPQTEPWSTSPLQQQQTVPCSRGRKTNVFVFHDLDLVVVVVFVGFFGRSDFDGTRK
jgi:hypothetical protein